MLETLAALGGRKGDVSLSDEDIARRVRHQFGRQAKRYTASRSHAQGKDLARLVALMPHDPTARLLDVATGTGHTALALAPHVREVVGLDLTPEMLAEAEELARLGNVANVSFVQGDALELPFAPQSFDLVTCRRAPHHFPDIPRFLREVVRVLRPGGLFGLVDQTTPESAIGARLIERFEQLRDPSHVHALTVSEWQRAFEDAGLHVRHLELDMEERDVAEYLDVAGVDEERRQQIALLIDGAPAVAVAMNGFVRRGGRLRFERRRIVAVTAV